MKIKALREMNRINLSKQAKQQLVYAIQHLAIALVAGSAETVYSFVILLNISKMICKMKKIHKIKPPKIIDPKLRVRARQ